MTALPNIPRLYTALAECLAVGIYALPLGLRFGKTATIAASAAWALALSAFLQATGRVPLAWWIPCMAAAVGIQYLYLWVTRTISLLEAGYVCARAFVLAELAASAEWQLHCFLWPQRSGADGLSLLLLVVVYGGVFRYHELKIQIADIRAERDRAKQDAALARMESGLRQYEAENKTGNPVLDTLLTAKSMDCQQRGINMTSVADGSQLGFLSTRELCTLVGAPLDNAIESVMAEPDPEKRLLRVAIYNQSGCVMLRFENYCAQPTAATTCRACRRPPGATTAP